MSNKKGRYEKYVVTSIPEGGYKVDYYFMGKYKRSIDYKIGEYAEMLLMLFKKECPKGQIVFSYSGSNQSTMVELERRVREYDPKLGIQSTYTDFNQGVG